MQIQIQIPMSSFCAVPWQSVGEKEALLGSIYVQDFWPPLTKKNSHQPPRKASSIRLSFCVEKITLLHLCMQQSMIQYMPGSSGWVSKSEVKAQRAIQIINLYHQTYEYMGQIEWVVEYWVLCFKDSMSWLLCCVLGSDLCLMHVWMYKNV